MDRNNNQIAVGYGNCLVALRKESVDRNTAVNAKHVFHLVALRKESVDRNISAVPCVKPITVALRKESVDRNKKTDVAGAVEILASLSARRAWIEIFDTLAGTCRSSSRSPQGERG